MSSKNWSAGDVVSAAELNAVSNQTIMVFADATARDAGFGGAGEPTLAEGMFVFLTSTNEMQIYTGAAWVTIGDPDIFRTNGTTPGVEIVVSSGKLSFQTGATGTLGQIAWRFNSTTTEYATLGIEYDNRASDGMLLDVGYPITLDYTTQMNIKRSGVTKGIWTADGLCFHGDTAAANALDDYEEGSWSPTYISTNGDMSGVTVNAAQTEGQYQKVGRWVTCTWFIRTDSITTLGTGFALLSGFPFDRSNRGTYVRAGSSAVGVIFDFVTRGPEFIWFPDNGGDAYLSYFSGDETAYGTLAATDLSTALNRNGFFGTVTYETDD